VAAAGLTYETAVVMARRALRASVALAQLLRGTQQPPAHDPEAASQTAPASSAPVVRHVPSTSFTTGDAVDLVAVAARLTIDVAPDGSVTVNGIPDDLPEDEARRIAEVATEAAVKQLRRILPARPVPSRDDRRLLNKVPREAVRAEARSNQAA
jgi:hypothetical protein